MEAKLRAQEIQAFSRYKSADGSVGVTQLEAGIQFKNGLFVGGTFSASALPITTNNITINGAAGNGYIQYGAQTVAPSLALVHTFADSGGHFAIGQSGSSGYTISFSNGFLNRDRAYDFQDKDGTLAMTGDDISTFVNDAGYLVSSDLANYVQGPASAVNGRLPSFNGTTGKLIRDSGINIAGTSGKTLTLTGGLTIGADTSITGGGTVALGGFTFTVPATGTGVITTRSLTSGAGLTGGGDLSANRTFDIGAGAGITVNADDVALTTPGTLTVSTVNASAGSHTHAITSSANPGAAAAILASDGSGFLRLVRLGIGIAPTQPLHVAGNAFIDAATANLYMKDTSTGFQAASTTIVTPQSGNSFRDPSYVSGVSGWTLDPNYFETGNGRFRGELAASVFKVSELSATAGTFGVFYSASTLAVDCLTAASTGSAMVIVAKNSDAGGMLFSVNDVVRIKAWTGAGISDAWATISSRTNNGSTTTYNAVLSSGSTSTTFPKGTAVIDYGPSGTGFITLSTDGTVGSSPNLTMATHAGSPWSTFTNLLRLGNLNGSYGYAIDIYGLGIGQYGAASKSWQTIDQTNGFRVGNNTSVLGQWDVSGNASFGQVTSGKANVYITAAGAVQMRDNTTVLSQWDSTGMIIGQNGAGQSNITIDSTNGLQLRLATTALVKLDTSGNALFGQLATNKANVYWNTSNNRLEFRGSTSGTVVQSYIDTDGSFTSGAGAVRLNSTGLQLDATNPGSSGSKNAISWVNSGTTVGRVYSDYDDSVKTAQLNLLSQSKSGDTGGSTARIGAYNNAGNPTILDITSFASGGANIGRANIYSTSITFSGLAVGSISSPAHMLDVYGTGWFQGAVNIEPDLTVGTGGTGTTVRQFILNGGSGTGGGPQITFQANSVTGCAIGTERAVAGGATSSTKLTLYSTTSTYRLYGLGAGTMTTDASGNVTITSDERLKIVKGDFRKGLSAIRKLRAIRYLWRKETGLDRSQEYVGFGARHTKRHIPEAIGKGQDGFHTMNDRVIIAALVNAVKELEDKYESLSHRIAA